MKLSDLDPAFVARLENWGMCYRARYRPAESVTYRVCQDAAAARGLRLKDDYRELNPKPDIDVRDALAMESAITGMSRLDRGLIVAYFAMNEDPRKTCRVLEISRSVWESLLCIAVVSLQGIVSKAEALI